MEKDKLWKTGTISLLILFLASLGVNVSQTMEDEGFLPYTCSIESVSDMLCYKLSRINDAGFQRYCYFDRDNSKRFKRCDEGWKLMEPDVFQSCPRIIAFTDNGKYYCLEKDGETVCINEKLEQTSFEDLS